MNSIHELLEQQRSGKYSAVQLTEQAVARAQQAQATYNTLISITQERALKRAAQIDAKRQGGESLGRLAGIPFIAKDNFLTFGGKTTAASKMLQTFDAPYQATAIERLEAEGAICIGKANLDAFAHGGSTENSYFGPTKNPRDPSRVPGGSSGGSAAAVALHIVPFALGTDTGGSIRQPASFTGVVGMKPTYGLVSRYGVVAMASSTDTIGVLAGTVDDAALVIDIMAGQDEQDSTTIPDRNDSYVPADTPKKSLKIGLIKEYMGESTASDVRACVQKQVEELRAHGHTVEEVSMPSVDLALAIYYIVVPAEISSNLGRYDGVRFGLSQDAPTLQDMYQHTREAGFMPENKRRILIGTYVLSSGYYDAYYRKAQTARTLLIQEFAKAFDAYDLLIGPVAPTTAFKLGEREDPLQMYMADIMTVAASLTGLPAISVPAGTGEHDLPVGLQIIGAQKADALVLAAAKQLEEINHA